MNQQVNFQNPGVPRPAQQGNPQPGGMQRNGGASSDIRAHIMKELTKYPTPVGWQQTVPPQYRIVIIQQMYVFQPKLTASVSLTQILLELRSSAWSSQNIIWPRRST